MQTTFLNVLATKKDDRLLTSVYQKPTHTERYIPFNSHHHRKTITGVLRGRRDRAPRICDPSTKQEELHHLQEVFQSNGFPPALVTKTLQAPPRQSSPPPPAEDSQPEEPQKTLRTPYVRGLSEKLKDPCPSGHPLHLHLSTHPEANPDDKRRGVVYQIPCNNCDHVYTRESKRTLKIHMAEHRRAVQKSDSNNGIAVHLAKSHHSIDLKEARVVSARTLGTKNNGSY